MKRLLMLIFLTAFSSCVYAFNLAECRSATDAQNMNYPQKIDEATTIITSYCYQDTKNIVYAYKYTVDISKDDWEMIPLNTKKTMIDEMRKMAKSRVCKKPILREMLKFVDMKYEYSLKYGEFMTQFLINRSDCGV